MNNFKKPIFNGILFGISLSFTLFITFICYAAWTNILTKTDGTIINATIWNEVVNKINTIGNTYAPTGFIGSFYLTTCPTGWIAADGTGGTPDLRGQFLRGINSFDSGVTTRSDGKQDPDCTSRSSGSCSVGSYQADELKIHNHSISQYNGNFWNAVGASASNSDGNGAKTNTTSNTGGNETRSKNVGVIFCIKQ